MGARLLSEKPSALRFALLLADFVADHSADSGAADGSDGAAACKYGSSDGASAPAPDGGALHLCPILGSCHEVS
ncbi:MAG: hypothetical protein IPN64_10400 [Propionivibrio sp.]|nr:hypothetical protein [Propionivibrio sp.]